MARLATGCFEGQMFQTIITQINGRKNSTKGSWAVDTVSGWGSSELGGYAREILLYTCATFFPQLLRRKSSRLEGSLTWPCTCSVAGESPWYIPRKHLSSSSFLPCESLAPVDVCKAKPIKAIFSVLCQASSHIRTKKAAHLASWFLNTVNRLSLVGFLLVQRLHSQPVSFPACSCSPFYAARWIFHLCSPKLQILWDIRPGYKAQHNKLARSLPSVSILKLR